MTLDEARSVLEHPAQHGGLQSAEVAEAVGLLIAAGEVCSHGDPLCPCPDGDMCHYEGPNPWPSPLPLPPESPPAGARATLGASAPPAEVQTTLPPAKRRYSAVGNLEVGKPAA